LVQRERKGNAKARKRGARLKIEKLKTSGLLELTPEVLQGKSVRDAVLEKLNVPGGTLPIVDTSRAVDFDYEEVISLDDYDTGSAACSKLTQCWWKAKLKGCAAEARWTGRPKICATGSSRPGPSGERRG
jgi:hypothetical protein